MWNGSQWQFPDFQKTNQFWILIWQMREVINTSNHKYWIGFVTRWSVICVREDKQPHAEDDDWRKLPSHIQMCLVTGGSAPELTVSPAPADVSQVQLPRVPRGPDRVGKGPRLLKGVFDLHHLLACDQRISAKI